MNSIRIKILIFKVVFQFGSNSAFADPSGHENGEAALNNSPMAAHLNENSSVFSYVTASNFAFDNKSFRFQVRFAGTLQALAILFAIANATALNSGEKIGFKMVENY